MMSIGMLEALSEVAFEGSELVQVCEKIKNKVSSTSYTHTHLHGETKSSPNFLLLLFTMDQPRHQSLE